MRHLLLQQSGEKKKNTLNVSLDSNFLTFQNPHVSNILLCIFFFFFINAEHPRTGLLICCILLNHSYIKAVCSARPLLTTLLEPCLDLSEVGH